MRLAVGLLIGLVFAPDVARAADPSALWKIVQGKCVPNEQTLRDPSPCSVVDLARGVDKGFVVLKDIKGVAQFLLIPTARIGGIEDPAILAPNATNYWDAAWQARYFIDVRLHTSLPRDAVGLAINSSVGRTQDQLHIHIDCIRPDVREALAAHLGDVSRIWTAFPAALAGQHYRAIRIDQETLDGVDPFRVLADKDPRAASEMGMHTLVLVGETFPDATVGFVLLDDRANLAAGDHASGEQLLDQSCAVASK